MSKALARSDNREIVRGYDAKMYDPVIVEFNADAGFTNYGYWYEDTAGQKQACENLMEQLLAFIPRKKGTVLDVACGKGATTRYLLKYYRPSQVTAINVSAKQLETARRNAPGCAFVQMDGAELAFQDACFDNVLCVEAAFHFNTRQRFFQNTHRILKPGGRLVLSDSLAPLEVERRRPGRTEENYLKDPQAYRAALRRAGFREETVIDATKECWERCFLNWVGFVHEKLLVRQIKLCDLERLLSPIYERVHDVEYYVLAAARKD